MGGCGHGGSVRWLQHEEGQAGNLTVVFHGGGATQIGSVMRLKCCGGSGFIGAVNGARRGGMKAWNRGVE
jgi:hypothetical protein